MGEVQQTLNSFSPVPPKWMCIPHIWTLSRPFDSAQNTAFLFFFYWQYPWLEYFCNDSDLFLLYANNDRRFLPIFLYAERKHNPFEMVWRFFYRLHWSQLSKRAALCGDSDPTDLPSSLLHWKSLQTMSIAWPHSCTGCKGRQVHLHTITTDGRIPFQLHFRSRGERSRGAYYCGWGKFSWNGRGDGKGSPLTLIWANNTAPASYEHPHRKMVSRWQSRPACLWQKTVN